MACGDTAASLLATTCRGGWPDLDPIPDPNPLTLALTLALALTLTLTPTLTRWVT